MRKSALVAILALLALLVTASLAAAPPNSLRLLEEAVVDFVAPPPPPPPALVVDAAQSSVEASASSLEPGQSVDITVTLRTSDGTVVPDKTVVLESSSASAVITPAEDVSDASGAAQFQATDSAEGSVTFTAYVLEDDVEIPPPPPPSGASVAPGESWQAAYDAAAPGDVIAVLAGNHGDQTLNGSKAVTFSAAAGGQPVLHNFIVHASNVTLDGVDIDGDGDAFTILQNGGDNNTYRNLEVRDNVDFQMVGNNGSHGLYENVVFHDNLIVTPGSHMECLWSNGPHLTIRNSRFYNCSVMDLFLTRGSWWDPPQPNVCCVTLEDNIFEPSLREGGGEHFYVIGIHDNADSLDGYVWKRNRFDLPVNTGDNAPVNSLFCENTGQAPADWQSPCP